MLPKLPDGGAFGNFGGFAGNDTVGVFDRAAFNVLKNVTSNYWQQEKSRKTDGKNSGDAAA